MTEIKIPMKFNPGMKKYEPDLPVRKGVMKPIKVSWGFIILAVLFIIAFIWVLVKFA